MAIELSFKGQIKSRKKLLNNITKLSKNSSFEIIVDDEGDISVFGFLLVFFSEVVIRERKLSNKYMSLTRTRCKYTQNSSISILKPRKTYKA